MFSINPINLYFPAIRQYFSLWSSLLGETESDVVHRQYQCYYVIAGSPDAAYWSNCEHDPVCKMVMLLCFSSKSFIWLKNVWKNLTEDSLILKLLTLTKVLVVDLYCALHLILKFEHLSHSVYNAYSSVICSEADVRHEYVYVGPQQQHRNPESKTW